jgi:hypothetical protein
MIHGGLQADLVAMAARVDACLHVVAVITRHEEVSFFLFVNRFPCGQGKNRRKKIMCTRGAARSVR